MKNMEKIKQNKNKTQEKPKHSLNVASSIIQNKEEIRIIVINMLTASILTGEIMQHIATDQKKAGEQIDKKLIKLLEKNVQYQKKIAYIVEELLG